MIPEEPGPHRGKVAAAMFPDPVVVTDRRPDEKSQVSMPSHAVMAQVEAKPRSAPAFYRRLLYPLFCPVNAKTPPFWAGFLDMLGSLTITYFHTGIRTIIGVESFHGPVRDGKGWDRLAMVIRHDLLSYCSWSNTTNLEEVAERMPLGITLGCACTAQH